AGPKFATATAAIQSYYEKPSEANMTGDEFITPSVITGPGGAPLATVRDGDSVVFYNYRGDRPREITKAFVMPDFNKDGKAFDRGTYMKDLYYCTMTAYEAGLPVHVAYPKPPKMLNTIGEYLSNLGLKQFRCAETEKFAHVTFFFNDYREEPNYANGDMVGHTGVLAAAVKAVEHVDICVGRLLAAIEKVGGAAIVLADHGNCEQMIDPATGGPHTAHTTYDVELFVVDNRFRGKKLREGGRLADVAPTALHVMGLPKPAEMTGVSLIPE
ncbi:MAG: phosphoglyceromutase, partial [Tepidisphaeraceae bacterium]